MAIYCMSGTGNSYYVGNRIAEELNVKLKNGLNIDNKDEAMIKDMSYSEYKQGKGCS